MLHRIGDRKHWGAMEAVLDNTTSQLQAVACSPPLTKDRLGCLKTITKTKKKSTIFFTFQATEMTRPFYIFHSATSTFTFHLIITINKAAYTLFSLNDGF